MSLCDLNCCDLKWLQTKFDAINKKISDNQKLQDKINANIFKILKESGIDVEALLKNYYALNEEDYTKTLTSEDDINTLEPGTYKIVKEDMPQNAPTGVASSDYDGTLIQSNSYAILFENGYLHIGSFFSAMNRFRWNYVINSTLINIRLQYYMLISRYSDGEFIDDIHTLNQMSTGVFIVNSATQNLPVQQNGIIIVRIGTATNSLFVTFIPEDSFDVYHCAKKSDGTWTEWEQVAFMSDVPSLTGYATENWVNQQIQDITGGSVTADWVKSNFLGITQSVYNTIQKNTDLNNIINPGTYKCLSNIIAQSLQNTPTQYAFTLFVTSGINANSLTQVLIPYNQFTIYIRKQYSNNFSDWFKLVTDYDLTNYATQTWVQSQNYLTEIPDNYATDEEVTLAITAALVGYATQAWVNEQISEITGGAVTTDIVAQMISDAIVGYATQSWVNGRGYQTATQVSAAITAAITGYATEQYVNKNYLAIESTLYSDIPENADLNNYTTVGNYFCSTSVKAKTLKNTPKGLNYDFKLTYEEIAANNQAVQKIVENSTGNEYIRVKVGKNWGEWINRGVISVFNTFSQLEITNLPCTTLDVYKAMPENSILLLGTDTTNGISDLPASTGVLEITKLSSRYRYKITFYKSSGGNTPPSKDIWVATLNNGLTQLTWEKVALMTDIPSLSGYASQEWVQQQGYQTVQQVNSLINTATADMLTQADLDTFNYATENWVLQTALAGYATENWVNTKLNDYLPKQQDMSLTTQGTYYGLQYQWARYGQVVEVFLVGNLTQEISNQLISNFCPANPMRTLQTVIPGYDDTKHYAEFNNDGLKLMGSYQNELYINCHFTYLTNE